MSEQAILDAFKRLKADAPAHGNKHRIYVAGCSGAPLALYRALQTAPELAADTVFLGVWIPGVNQEDWAGLHPTAEAESIFLSPAVRASFEAGRFRFFPFSYLQAWRWLLQTPLDAAVAVTAPGGPGGQSLGVSQDFTPAIFEQRKIPVLVLRNAHMPKPRDGCFILPIYPNDKQHVIDDETPVLTMDQKPLDQRFLAIGRRIAGLIEDSTRLQFGLGNVQAAVLDALRDHRGLRIHSGMISDPVTQLLDAGALADHREAIKTGVALGTKPFYERMANEDRVLFRPVPHTHSAELINKSPLRFAAVNSLIEVDLFGQGNAEFIGSQQVSGAGGLVEFARPHGGPATGQSIHALVSTAKGGTVSRIVPRLNPNAVSLTRHDLRTVVTEHGVAQLEGTDIDTRAERLISIADPGHRDHLAHAWDAMRRQM